MRYYSLINSMSRGGSTYDADAQAFLTATGIPNDGTILFIGTIFEITGLNLSIALNNFVLTLKSLGLWNKIYFLHPMIGGSSSSCSYNLINTATYQLVFNGGWSFSGGGALPNGTDAYAETGFVPQGIVSQNSSAYSYYSRTNNTITENNAIMGSVGSSPLCGAIMSSIGATQVYWCLNDFTFPLINVSGSLGLLTMSRTGSTTSGFFRKTTKTSVSVASVGVPNRSLVLGANKSSVIQQYSSYECALASAQEGFSDSEVSDYNTAVETFQTALSRNV